MQFSAHDVDFNCPCPRCRSITSVSLHTSGHKEEYMEGTHKGNVQEWAGKYVIWSPESSLPIQYAYDDRPTAIKVAYSMASRYPTQRFMVLKVAGVAKTSAVTFEDLEAPKPARVTRARKAAVL